MTDSESSSARPDPFEGEPWVPDPADDSTDDPAAPKPHRRRLRISRRKLRRRRRIGLVMIVLGGLIVLGLIWVLITGLLARSQLQTVRTEVRTLRAQLAAGNLAAARVTARELTTHADRAHSLTTGPAWASLAAIPGSGPVATVRAITAQVAAVGDNVLPPLVDASTRIDPKALRLPDGSFDLAKIASVQPVLDSASTRLQHATASIAAQPAHTWLGAVDHARSDLLTQLSSLSHTVRSADLASHVAPPMLGATGTRRYFVAFQNEAESRGTGGIPGAFAIVRATHGKVSFERFEPDNTLGIVPTNLQFGPGYAQLFNGAKTTSLYVNSNLSPNFPYAAQIWLAMWRKHSGEQLDGALAVDPTALSYFLAVTGPATLPGGGQLTAGNVVALTQSTVYARFPKPAQNAERKQYLLDIARVASHKVLDTRPDLTALIKAAGRAVGERRLLVYSTAADTERRIRESALSGAIPQTSRPYVGLSIVNDGGNKLDYYLERSLTWQRTGCGSTRQVTVSIRLTNAVPLAALNPYLTARSDRRSYPIRPGDNRLEVSYYATSGALMRAVQINGQPATAGIGADLGHSVYTVDLELPRDATRTITFHLTEPAGHGTPLVLHQPLVRPLQVTLHDAKC